MVATRPSWIIIGLAVFILMGIVVLTVYQHETNERVFLSHFKEYQLLYAHHIADQIETMLWGYRRVLQALPSFTPDLADDKDEMERLRSDIQAYSSYVEEDYIDAISLYNKEGITFYSTDSNLIGLNENKSAFFHWARKKENRQRLFVSPLFTGEENRQTQGQSRGTKDTSANRLKIFLAIPLYHRAPSETPRQWDWKFTGAVSFLIDFEKFLTHELKGHAMTTHYVWMMDRDSRLLFQSEHPEMVMRNIHQRDRTCIQCHVSFNYIDEILQKSEGTLGYHLKNAPKKLAAFAPVKVGDLSWVVVINSSYDSVSAFIRKSLRQSLLLLSAVVLSFVLGSVYLIYNDRVKVRAEEESKHWQEMTAERKKSEETLKRSEEQLRHLHSRLLTTQEEERRRISGELHDGLGSALVTLKLRENLIKGKLREDQGGLINECEKTIRYVDQIIEDVHRLSRNLTPSVLEHLGLSASIRWLANENSPRNNTEVTLDVTNVDHHFSQEAKITIYRIFQESFTNIEKYAQAKNVLIVIKECGDEVSFSIEDDGKGFDLMRVVSRNITQRGLGLATMKERTRMLGGQFDLWSEQEKGTRITFRIPKVKQQGGEA